MLKVSNSIILNDQEIEYHSIRAQGAGGQNVNKVASAIHLRFSISDSSLPDRLKNALLTKKDSRISKDGIIIIKSQNFRTREKNLEDAKKRLFELILSVSHKPKKRKATRPTRNAKKKRLDGKKKRGQLKSMRKKVF